MAEGAGSYFDVRNWLRDKWEIPEGILKKPGGRKVRIIVWILWSFGGGSGQGYASIPTLAGIIGSSEATVRRALRLACGLKILKSAGRYKHGTVIYEFPFIERAVREMAEEAEHPTKRRVRIKKKGEVPAERVPLDETGLIPPAVDPTHPKHDWAASIADQIRFFCVVDGRHVTLKEILYALDHGATEASIVSAFKANGIAKIMRKANEILKACIPKRPLNPPRDLHQDAMQEEAMTHLPDDMITRLSDEAIGRCAPRVRDILEQRKRALLSPTDPAQVRAILKDAFGEPEEQDK